MFQTSPEPSFLDKFIVLLQVLVVLVLAASGFIFQDEFANFIKADDPLKSSIKFWAFLCFCVALTAQGVLIYFVYIQSTKIADLSREHDILSQDKIGLETKLNLLTQEKERIEHGILKDFYSISKALCMTMANKLEFGTKPDIHERISFYVFDSSADCFLLLSRYSVNAEFDSKGHDMYQKKLGNIGKVWNNVFCFENDYPSYAIKKDREEYIKRNIRDGFKRQQVIKFRMKSRLYSGFRIKDSKEKPLAVVMVEATDPFRWSKDFLQNFFKEESTTLNNLFEIIHNKTPEISSARKKGF
jgi:hypothetical protein